MASSDNLYVTFVDVDRDLLKVWGQKSRIVATYVERQLLQLIPEFNRSEGPSPSQVRKGMFCFAKYSDDNYYRARVISNVQNDSVGVLFVDYGNKNFIHISNIRVQNGSQGDMLAKMAEQAEDFYLSGVKAPNGGWTNEIVSEIRHDICYEEFACKTVTQVADQKILEIQFHDESFSDHLLKKQIVNSVSLQTQTQMILSYCSLVSNDPAQSEPNKEKSRDNYFAPPSPTGNSQGLQGNTRTSSRLGYFGNESRLNYEKPKMPANFFRPPPSQFYPSKNPVSTADKNSPPSSYYPQNNPNGSPKMNKTQTHSNNSGFNPMLQNQRNPMYQAKENASLPLLNSFNNVMIEALAKQIKQYIAEDGIKLDEEKTPQHYVSSVLNVDGTYSVFISCIDDGPWSFSVRLLSSESDLEKLIQELGSCELNHIKPPIIVGQPCIALSQSGNFCRGVIVSVSHSAVKVYFVDFGNTEDLPVSSIYDFPPKFFKTRVLSQKFSLNGLQKVAYSEDIKRFFSEVVQDKLLLLRVVSLEDDNLPTCELYLKDQNIKRILNEKMRELKAFTEEEVPKAGESENVVVTWVISPQKFFVQLRRRDSELSKLKSELSEVETKGQEMSFQQLSIGLKCVSRYVNDGNWYRAVITGLNSENSISVFYIDYGNSENVGISLLRKYDGSLIVNQMAPQAIQCSLKGFENDPFDQNIADKLETIILEKDLKMTVVSSDKDQVCVQLFDNGGQDIAKILSSSCEPKNDVTSPAISENEWSMPQESDRSDTKPHNKFEKRNKFSENIDYYDRRDNRSFRGDKNKEKRNTNRQLSDLKRDKSQPKSTNQNFKKRFDDSESWSTRKSDDFNFYTKDKYPGARGFNKENNWGDRRPLDGQKFSGNRGPRQDDWNDRRKFDVSKGGVGRKFPGDGGFKGKFDGFKSFGFNSGPVLGGKGFERKPDNEFVSKNKFQGVKLEKPFSGVDKRSDEGKFRKPVFKENIVPPGSKFEEKTIEIGQCEKGIVTYYFSPDEFYIQLLADEDEFKKMMSDIQQYYSDKYSLREPVEAGDIVIAQFSLDKVLYRAVVVKPLPVTVRYVDYGNQEPVGAKCTWPVDKRFLKLPAQVVKCRLSGVRPIGSDWPPPSSEIDKFFDSEEYDCTFLKFEDGVYEIQMTSVQSGKDVASEIIAAKLGKPSDSDFDIPEIDFSLLPKQHLQLPISKIESSNMFYIVLNPKSVDLINEGIRKFSEHKENLIPLEESSLKPKSLCLITDEGNIWRRGVITEKSENKILVRFMDRGDTIEVLPEKIMNLPENLKIFQSQAIECCLHDPLSPLDEIEFKNFVEQNQQLIVTASVQEKRLSVVLYDQMGKKLFLQKAEDFPENVEPLGDWPLISRKTPVLISHYESPQEIFLQRASDRHAIKELSKQLMTFYSEKELSQIEEGDKLVAANSIVYKSWRRGRIVASTEDLVEVFYIDFGSRESLPSENIRKLDESFSKLSGFAKKVRLDTQYDEQITKEISSKILNFTKRKELLGYFKNNAGELFVDLVLDGENVLMLLKRLTLPVDVDNYTEESPDTSSLLDENVVDNEEILEDDSCVVYMTHQNSPNDFFIQRETCTDILNDLTQKMLDADSFETATSVQENDIIAAKFIDDGVWYRAKVLKKIAHEVEVLFIDYGNTSTVNEIKYLPSDLVEIPYLAENCCLILGNNCDSWSEAACEKFSEFGDGRQLKMKIVVNRTVKPIVRLRDQVADVSEVLETLCEDDGRVEVYISQAFSPTDFYMQYSNDEEYKKISEKLENVEEEYENLEDKTPGTICQARFVDDDLWYRAKILRNLDEGCEVFFIDFGNISVSTELKKLPPEIENIPPRAMKCKLDLKEKNIPESIKEEFINLTIHSGTVFRARIITPGEVNVVSLKVDGRILEETMILDSDSEDSVRCPSTLNSGDLSNSLDDETDDDKNSKITVPTESYLNSNLEDDARAGSSICNETDEEKRVKIANAEGFKSDDEKGISLPSGMVNVTDNELIEEFQDANEEEETTETTEEVEEFSEENAEQDSTEAGQGDHKESTLENPPANLEDETEHNSINTIINPDNSSKKLKCKNHADKIVPGSISRGESEKDLNENIAASSRKLTHSEKLVPGCISRGVSLEFMANGEEKTSKVCEKQVSQSAPNTPKFVRRSTDENAHEEVDQNDRVIPGFISGSMPTSCNTEVDKVPFSEKIVSGSVNGSVTDN